MNFLCAVGNADKNTRCFYLYKQLIIIKLNININYIKM